MRAIHCNGLHSGLGDGEQRLIQRMTCAPLTAPEDLKVLIREEISKICPAGHRLSRIRGAPALPSPGGTWPHGQYLLVGLPTLSGAYMRLIYVLLHQLDCIQESPPLYLPWYEPPFLAPSATDVLEPPRDHRTPEEVASFLKGRHSPAPQTSQKGDN